MSWTKGFKATNVEGHDVVQLLRDACRRRGVNIFLIYFNYYKKLYILLGY